MKEHKGMTMKTNGLKKDWNLRQALLFIALGVGVGTPALAQTTVCSTRGSNTHAICLSVDKSALEISGEVKFEAWSEIRSGSNWSPIPASIVIWNTQTERLATGNSTSQGPYKSSFRLKSLGQHRVYARDGFSTSPEILIAVGKHSPVITLSASPTTSMVGESVQLSSSITLYKPDGVWTFYAAGTGGPSGQFAQLPIKDEFLDPYYGWAINDERTFYFVAPFNVPGNYDFTLSYLGDQFNHSVQRYFQTLVRVGPFETTTTLSQSATNSMMGTAITLSASVAGTNPNQSIPTGTVIFFDGQQDLQNVPVNAQGTASLVVRLPRVGQHSITARYLGDASNPASTSAAITHTVALNPAIVISVIDTAFNVKDDDDDDPPPNP